MSNTILLSVGKMDNGLVWVTHPAIVPHKIFVDSEGQIQVIAQVTPSNDEEEPIFFWRDVKPISE